MKFRIIPPMEPHKQHYEFTASSSLSQQQLEVFTLFQMVGVDISNEKFQVTSSFECLKELVFQCCRLCGSWYL